MSNIKQDAIELLKQLPDDKVIFIIQIMRGMEGLYVSGDMQRREAAYNHLEKMRRHVHEAELDYKEELRYYREGKYSDESID